MFPASAGQIGAKCLKLKLGVRFFDLIPIYFCQMAA